MTPRQVLGLLNVIQKADLIATYTQISVYGLVHGAKLPSLDEFLGVTLKEKANDKSAFDVDADKFLEAQAQKRLEEMRKNVK